MHWKVPYIDYPSQYKKIRAEVLSTIDQMLSQGDVMLRHQLKDFEIDLARFVGTRWAVGVSNCTDALHLCLRAEGVTTGDEVITVSHTFIATAAAIHHVGAKPVLVDIDEDHNMNIEHVEQAITARTKAIVPVHLNGRLCNMEKLMSVASRHGIVIIEDAAQALGASFKGRRGGAFGRAGCFSFYPAKLLGTYGDAGAVVADSTEFAEKIRLLRNHGRYQNNDVAFWSFNCRMDNIHAGILDLKLKYLPMWIERRRGIARMYNQLLCDIPQLQLPPPPVDNGAHFDVFQNYEIEAENRDDLVSHLKEMGVEILIPWGGRGVHQFKELKLGNFHLPRTEKMLQRVLMLPMNAELTDDQVVYVTKVIRNFYLQ